MKTINAYIVMGAILVMSAACAINAESHYQRVVKQERITVVEKPYNSDPKLALAIVSVDGVEYLVSSNGGIVPLDSKP